VNVLSTLASILSDCLIAAVALVLAYRGMRYLWTLIDDRWLTPVPVVDLAANEIWDVLAEARRITEQGDPDATE
jgi:hypothetical protein